MKKGRDDLFNTISKERLTKVENISKAKVQSSKSNYKTMEKPPQEYVEAHGDEEKSDLINKMFFLESQVYYLEKALEEEQKMRKKLEKEEDEGEDSET